MTKVKDITIPDQSDYLMGVGLLADHCVILVVAVVGISESKKKYKLFTDNKHR